MTSTIIDNFRTSIKYFGTVILQFDIIKLMSSVGMTLIHIV